MGGVVSSIFGSENEYHADAIAPNQLNYQYGGEYGFDRRQAQKYADMGAAAQGRQGVGVDYTQANIDRQRSLGARQGEVGIANAMRDRAMGRTGSIAGQQARRDMQQMQAQQMSAAASARGGAGLALAQQGAANNMANAASGISGQAQINAARERMAAEQAAMGAYGQIRGGDMASQQAAAQRSQYAAGLQDQQRARNDAFQMSMSQLENNVHGNQLAARGNYEAQFANNQNAAHQINSGVARQNADTNQQNASQLMSAAGNVAGLLMMSDGSSKNVGPRVDMSSANRSMAGAMYKYKDEYTPAEQAPGEANVGPMADAMAKDPIASTAVREGPDGKKYLDMTKSLKLVMSGVADLQRKYDALAGVEKRASGGPVDAGQPYIVGENGPELMVPQQPGIIVPNRGPAITNPMASAMSEPFASGQQDGQGWGQSLGSAIGGGINKARGLNPDGSEKPKKKPADEKTGGGGGSPMSSFAKPPMGLKLGLFR